MKKPPKQKWDPQKYVENARFVADLGAPVVELLAPRAGEKILDLGCGDGALALKIVTQGSDVVAIDSSPEMVEAARTLGLDAMAMDGEAMTFSSEFDAVFSNAALHWMKRPDLVISGVWKALRPGGRFVGECGGDGNVAVIVSALATALARRGYSYKELTPWFFPGDIEYRRLLELQDFQVVSISLFPRITRLPGDLVDWLETFAQSFTAILTRDDRLDFLHEVAKLCEAQLCDKERNWSVDYVRLRFSAFKH
jgi:trans-aconitate methyltransferase